jgi:protein-S-isoprenylcysteine O-methyltransferase Ste14
MEEEAVFRGILLALWIGLFSIRVYYAARLRYEGESVSPGGRAVRQREGTWIYIVRILLFCSLIAALLIYTFRPQWMGSFILPFPSWLRWTGVALGVLSLPLLMWVQHTLGRQWSSGLQLREQHTLVISGPYRWVRHPMYSVIFLFLAALCLVSANWLFLLGALAAIVLLYRRMGQEEEMMIGQFGDQYRLYVARTGRLLPSLRRMED